MIVKVLQAIFALGVVCLYAAAASIPLLVFVALLKFIFG